MCKKEFDKSDMEFDKSDMDTTTVSATAFTFMPSHAGDRYLRGDNHNRCILLRGDTTLYRQWRQMNPRSLRNSVLLGGHYVCEVLNEIDRDTRLRQLMGLSKDFFDCFDEKVTHTEIVREGPIVSIEECCVIFSQLAILPP